jgi:hypothetical protein
MKKIYLILWLSLSVTAQTGGTYQIEKSVVVTGGGASLGGSLALESTTGQPLAGGPVQGSPYSLSNGFWTFNLVPTAARVSIGGRVTTPDGRGIRSVLVSLTSQSGEVRYLRTGSFGSYRFDEVTVGEIYILTASGKKFVFTNPTLVINVTEELNNLNFVAEEQ